METIKGEVTDEPLLRFTNTGKSITTFKLAMENRDKPRKVNTWEELAEKVNEVVYPEDQVYLKGYWKTNSFEGRDGKQYSSEEFTAQGVWIIKDGKPIDIMEMER